jgi:hypothetical protein
MGNEDSFIRRAYTNAKEDAKLQHDIDKEHIEAIKGAENEDFKEFREAQGFKEKLGVLLNHAERDAKTIRADQREDYQAMLKQMREDANTRIR